jgi:hypothetical protein
MHTLYIHIDEDLDEDRLRILQKDLCKVRHITDVEIHKHQPHDLLVEFEEQRITPMNILQELNKRGVHGDIMSA